MYILFVQVVVVFLFINKIETKIRLLSLYRIDNSIMLYRIVKDKTVKSI
jgi:hypothetical protein